MQTKLTDFSERQLKLMYRIACDEKCRIRIHMKGITAVPGLQKLFMKEVQDLLTDLEELDLWIVQISSALKDIILREQISDN